MEVAEFPHISPQFGRSLAIGAGTEVVTDDSVGAEMR